MLKDLIQTARKKRGVDPAAMPFLDWLEANPNSQTYRNATEFLKTASITDAMALLAKFDLSEWLDPADAKDYQPPLLVYGVWSLPNQEGLIVLEMTSTRFLQADISTYRRLTLSDLKPYTGPPPRKIHGLPLPDTLYASLGITKAMKSAMTDVLPPIRMRPDEVERIRTLAESEGKSVSDLIRERLLQ